MGYGSRALQQLQMYYEGKFPTMDESTQPAHTQITSVSSEVREGCFSHDLTTALSDLIKGSYFRRRFLSLLSYQFSSFHPSLALSILQNKKLKEETTRKMFENVTSQLEKEIELPSSQLMGLFNRLIRKFVQTEAAKEFEERHKKDLEKVKEMDLEEYKIRGDEEEWDQVLKNAGNTAIVSIKRCNIAILTGKHDCVCFLWELVANFYFTNSDKKRKWEGGIAVTSNGAGKQKKEMKHGKFKKNKDKHGKFGKKA
ncbi:hypothetical protein XENOCAPTIV_029967 [Xenoophorus captivus]|uniref:Possible tRNA binding domain-containing protein n=1 Tax=Xenoophorus captivus TaxID=1517983 RepID=A0ABV0QCP1_9TELE